eukprot:991783-Lingulodinium_polyedra.AAC.1
MSFNGHNTPPEILAFCEGRHLAAHRYTEEGRTKTKVWCLLCACCASVEHFDANRHLLRMAQDVAGGSLGFSK